MGLRSWLESESITSLFRRFLEERVRPNKLEPDGWIWGLIIGVNFMILSLLIALLGRPFIDLVADEYYFIEVYDFVTIRTLYF
jgi:hypothetical protein